MQEVNVRPSKMRRFWKETVRVLRITKKPNREEFTTSMKVTGIGIAIIGVIGFIIFLFRQLLF